MRFGRGVGRDGWRERTGEGWVRDGGGDGGSSDWASACQISEDGNGDEGRGEEWQNEGMPFSTPMGTGVGMRGQTKHTAAASGEVSKRGRLMNAAVSERSNSLDVRKLLARKRDREEMERAEKELRAFKRSSKTSRSPTENREVVAGRERENTFELILKELRGVRREVKEKRRKRKEKS